MSGKAFRLISTHSLNESELLPLNLKDIVVGVTSRISANFAWVILLLAISASKFGNTSSLPFSIFRDYVFSIGTS